MKLIVGLGNPEVKYMKTRHNVGFMVVDKILQEKSLKLTEKFKSFFVKDGDILYAMPKTYMNLSGQAVSEIVKFFKLDIKDVLIVYDDISLPLGTLRYRTDGSDGGHNGIKSIIKDAGSKSFPRLKVGIGPQPINVPSERFVLDNFKNEELDKLAQILKVATSFVYDWSFGVDDSKLQNLYNKAHL